PHLPSNDRQSWYYPGVAIEHDDDRGDLPPGTANGNWGKKDRHGARFVRRGHIAAWGPTRGEYDIEERARKRLRMILPEFSNELVETDPILPHLRSPSPPLTTPFTPISQQHTSHTASILDPNIGASFRSNLLHSLERSASELIQSEIALTRALGRFWTAITETATRMARDKRHELLEQQKQLVEQQRQQRPPMEVEGEDNPEGNKEPSAFPPIPDHNMIDLDDATTRNVILRMFTLPTNMRLDYVAPGGAPEIISVGPGPQAELVSRSMLAIRELQEDSKECMERLEEIREMLGKVKGLRDAVWAIMRSQAIAEMENE
ncbi:hypothetical protein M408DRAFT_334325, partial [Serendipita vermifera MAFF 305830]